MQVMGSIGSEFGVISDFLLQNHDKAYKSPKNAKNAKEKEEMEYLFNAGKTSNTIFNDKLNLLAVENNLYDIKNKNFLDGTCRRIRNYYWGQLKSAEYYRYPESIAVFCEVVDNNHIRYRVSLELDEKKASKEDITAFLRVLDRPLKKGLFYIGNMKYDRRLIVLSQSKKEIKEKLAAGIYNKIQISYLPRTCKSDDEMYRELDKGIKLLLPYYEFILN